MWSGTALFQLNSILASNRLNEFRFEFGREERPRIAQAEGPQVTVQNAGATVAAYGPQGTGISFGNGQFPSRDNRYQIADNLSIVSGAHTVKVGGDLVRIASDVVFAPGSNGVYTFSSLANYLARTPSAYSQFTGTGQVSSTIEFRFVRRVARAPTDVRSRVTSSTRATRRRRCRSSARRARRPFRTT